MKSKKNFQIKITAIVLLILLLISSLQGKVLARDNYAFSVGTTSDGINTTSDMNDAVRAYSNAGYTSSGAVDPTPQGLWGNLYADVQFFSSHGNVKFVEFSQTGIIVGDTGYYTSDDGTTKYFYGTNDVHWNTDTILVTYSSCNSAGANNINDVDSITYKTAERGATVAVGFREEIDSGSATNWNARYNQKLGEGYGVFDATEYASSFIYLDSDVKKVQVWHHGDANMKIGKYRSTGSGLGEERNILNKLSTRKLVTNDIESISSAIKEVYPNFNIENYEISSTDGTRTSLVNSDSVQSKTSYIDLKFKIGNFYTDAGYTVEIKDNTVVAIYDNNVNLEKQENLVNIRKYISSSLTSSKIEELKQTAKKQVSDENTDTVKIDESAITYNYFYDINTDKEYIIFSIPNYTNNGGKSFSNVQIEI